MLVPILLVFAAEQLGRHRLAVHALLLGLQAVHFAQPDAGQATALGLGVIGLLLSDPRQRFKVPLVCSYLITIAGTWLRFDPLPPVMFVEDIVPQAFALTPVAGVVALASLALFVLSPLLSSRERGPIAPAAALVGYFAGSLIGTSFGEFPVPLLGFGTSPTVGAFLGLAAFRRLQLASSDTQHCDVPQSQQRSRASGTNDRLHLTMNLLARATHYGSPHSPTV
jgi:hypothetical protein